MKDQKPQLEIEDFAKISTIDELKLVIANKGIDIEKTMIRVHYESELKKLQIEMVKLQRWILKNKKRVIILFEGRDAAGKGGNIRRFSEHLNPRSMRTVALTKPTEKESGQWYFERYIKEFPSPGEMVLFDRSWYNRAVVEPVMGFCDTDQYKKFMTQVPEFEHMLYDDGIKIIKLWFSISKGVQQERFDARLKNPLKRWKFSPVDKKGQERWDDYTKYKEKMFSGTHTSYSPWIIVKANNKKRARLEAMRYVLSQFEYEGKDESLTNLYPDPNVVMRYFRSNQQID
ncbi:MAG: polyphosphate kinase 2 [Flavobacteriaceae bacterium]|nr:polyphosphate kinase 2 [Flavobacteriaceae bacterium]